MKREELKFRHSIYLECDKPMYAKSEADSVMDDMEARINKLKNENAQLKDALKDKSQVYAEIELDRIERINTCTTTIRKLRDENARLRCLALHAIHDLLFLEQLYTRKAADFYKQFLPKEQYWKMQEKGDRRSFSKWLETNRKRHNKLCREWKQKNRAHCNEYHRQWVAKNKNKESYKAKKAEYNKRYRQKKKGT